MLIVLKRAVDFWRIYVGSRSSQFLFFEEIITSKEKTNTFAIYF